MDNVEGPGKLEEWVSASRLANPDKLSLRHLGRPMIRPCPPEEPSRQYFEVGAAVEAWWNNCWWESFVLTGVSLSSNNDTYRVFLPGECTFENLHCKYLRVAKDWIDNTWVAVKPQPDILSVHQFYHLALFLSLLFPYNRNKLKADIAERITMLRLAITALAIPSPTWLQNFPYMVHTFIHCKVGSPIFENNAACKADAVAAKHEYVIIWQA
ncbi:hypothetical protein POM88_014521 [Heracleum sosnowskyi]|uniref:Agenet domain-containing protein n=1 Tax=Heracleum sosnowskyi TaxID=360622 RepID=A0AAD8J0H8_9APIA|nr:hypothetical protein POM88_014521 [Heracleum sosnowskyi]